MEHLRTRSQCNSCEDLYYPPVRSEKGNLAGLMLKYNICDGCAYLMLYTWENIQSNRARRAAREAELQSASRFTRFLHHVFS